MIGRHSSGLISFSFYLSIIGLAIGTASLLLISIFSNGFSEKVKSKLATIDGDVRIEKYSADNNSEITLSEFKEIKSIAQNIDEINSIFFYSQTQAMLQTGQQSDGTLLFGVDSLLLVELSRESDLLLSGEFKNNNIILGDELAKNLGLNLGDKVNLFDLNLLTKNQNIKATALYLNGLISTGFSEYDKLISFIPQKTFSEFYNKDDTFSGIILNTKTNNNSYAAEYFNNLLDFPFMVNTWQERHSLLLEWMNIYYIPINLVMWFITILAIFNISSTLWMISLDKISNVSILKAMGFSNNKIRNIFILKGVIIGLIGICIGIVISGIIYIIQSNYHLIKLSSEVYFIEFLPVKVNLNEIMFTLFGIFFTTILFSLIPANKVKNIIPAEILKEH